MTKSTKTKTSTSTSPTKGATRAKASKATTSPNSAKNATRANDAPLVQTKRAMKVTAPKLSAMKAAVKVLAKAPEEGMSTKDMIEAMRKQRLWTSPNGKTPEASLYAGITREIAKKGDEARFRKVAKGRFVLA